MTMHAEEYKKNLFIRAIPNSGLWQIAFSGGGEVPDFLKGSYTSKNTAKQRIDRYYEIQKTPTQRRVAKKKAAPKTDG